MNFRRDLPLLNALAVFATAARTESFSAAAKELNLVQSAVSRHVANLEAQLHIPLFERSGRRVRVTPDGERLAKALEIGFGHIVSILGDLQRERETKALTIACSYDVAYLWLMPRLRFLRDRVPDHELRLTTFGSFESFDPRRVDIFIRYGRAGDWPGGTQIALFREAAFPICSARFLDAHPDLIGGDPRAIARVPLLHVQSRGVDWHHWFAMCGMSLPGSVGQLFAHYTGLLYETLAGTGVALGWEHMLGDLLERGLLVRLSEQAVASDRHLIAVHRAEPGSAVAELAESLTASMQEGASDAFILAPAPAS